MWPFSKKKDITKEIRMSIQKSMDAGTSFDQWLKDITPLLRENNLYKEEIRYMKNGKEKVFLANREELQRLFQSCMHVLYAKRRYESQISSDAEYLRYSAILDQNTDPDHRSVHGIILPKTHPWWDINYPPNGWRCRCKASALTATQLKSRGLSVYDGEPKNIAAHDWAYHPGKTDRVEEHISLWIKAQQAPLGGS